MASVFPRSNYKTFLTVLAGTSKTTCYTVGADGEDFADVVGIRIVDSTGAVAAGATIHVTLATGGTEGIFNKRSLVEASWPLEDECFPLHLDAGGTIKVTGASGHHVWITIHKGTDQSSEVQR